MAWGPQEARQVLWSLQQWFHFTKGIAFMKEFRHELAKWGTESLGLRKMHLCCLDQLMLERDGDETIESQDIGFVVYRTLINPCNQRKTNYFLKAITKMDFLRNNWNMCISWILKMIVWTWESRSAWNDRCIFDNEIMKVYDHQHDWVELWMLIGLCMIKINDDECFTLKNVNNTLDKVLPALSSWSQGVMVNCNM